MKSRPPGFSLTFRTCTFRLIAALTGPTIFSRREAPSVLRKKITYVLKDESDRSHLPANCNLAPKAEKGRGLAHAKSLAFPSSYDLALSE